VRDIVAATLRHLDDLDAAERRARVEAVLEEVGLPSFGSRSPIRCQATTSAGRYRKSGGFPAAPGGR